MTFTLRAPSLTDLAAVFVSEKTVLNGNLRPRFGKGSFTHATNSPLSSSISSSIWSPKSWCILPKPPWASKGAYSRSSRSKRKEVVTWSRMSWSQAVWVSVNFCSVGMRRTRKFDHGEAKLSWCGGARERDRRSWFGDQGWSGGELDFGKPEWKAQHATERSGVKCGAWNGGFPKSPRRGIPLFTRPPELSPRRPCEGR